MVQRVDELSKGREVDLNSPVKTKRIWSYKLRVDTTNQLHVNREKKRAMLKNPIHNLGLDWKN